MNKLIRIKKSKIFVFLIVLFLVTFFTSFPVSALKQNGDGNGPGNAGNEGNSGNLYAGGAGWRVYVADKSGNTVIEPQDIYYSGEKRPKPGELYWIGSTKLNHGNNVKLEIGYFCRDGIKLPRPGSDHKTLKHFWTQSDYFNLKLMITEIKWNHSADEIIEKMQAGEWFVVMEPVMYVRVDGINLAITATEAGNLDKYLFDGQMCGNMGSATHNMLPGWGYLIEEQWGISPGAKFNPNGMKFQLSDEVMISTYGIISIGMEGDPEDTGDVYDYEFHTDTDVIVAVEVSSGGSEIDPDDDASATFRFPGQSLEKGYVIPEDDSQLVWVKWRTPKEAGVIDVPVSVSDGTPDRASLKIKLTKLEENTPPDPLGRDTNKGFKVPNLPTTNAPSSLSWSEWSATKKSGSGSSTKWKFKSTTYTATLALSGATIKPDERAKTAVGQDMKSGYGFNAAVNVSVKFGGNAPSGDDYADVQYVVTTFPEFDYEYFTRHLKKDGNTWQFQENEYSQFKNRVHFTPIWYPDNSKYITSYTILDCWTPAGQLSCVVNSDAINIDSNVFADWHTAPAFAYVNLQDS